LIATILIILLLDKIKRLKPAISNKAPNIGGS
jgi:hypothetical protein